MSIYDNNDCNIMWQYYMTTVPRKSLKKSDYTIKEWVCTKNFSLLYSYLIDGHYDI